MMVFDDSFNREAMTRIRAKLYAVNSYFAWLDYSAANPKGRRYDWKGNPLPLNSYSLSPVTNEAREYYAMSLRDVWENDAEAQIKGYLARLRRGDTLDKILAWEMEQPARYNNNPWRDKDVKP